MAICTIGIGYVQFDRNLSLDALIKQAVSALYYCKATTRNAVHDYHQLVSEGLIPAI